MSEPIQRFNYRGPQADGARDSAPGRKSFPMCLTNNVVSTVQIFNKGVHNDLHVQGFSSGDTTLRWQVFERIYRDPLFERYAGLPDPPVRVFVDRGRVTLAGTVGSEVEQVAVGMIARGTLAFTVSNQVQVEGDAARKEDRKKDADEG